MKHAPSDTKITCIIWDYDGTLVDTRSKNLSVTKQIIGKVTNVDPNSFPIFASPEIYGALARRYANWRDFYADQFHMEKSEIDRAGLMWTEYQAKDKTRVDLYQGMGRTISTLSKYPQGIVSQNSIGEIESVLKRDGLARYFQTIVGYREVPIDRQKPEPDGLLMCIDRLTGFAPGRVVYVGDHDTDTRCARRANRVLGQQDKDITITTVAAQFGNGVNTENWAARPDHEAKTPADVLDLVAQLAVDS